MKTKAFFILAVCCFLVSVGLLLGLTLHGEKVLAWGFQYDMELVSHYVALNQGEEFTAPIPPGKLFVLTGIQSLTSNSNNPIEVFENEVLKIRQSLNFTGNVYYTGIPFKGGSLLKIRNPYPPLQQFTIIGHVIDDRGQDSGMFK